MSTPQSRSDAGRRAGAYREHAEQERAGSTDAPPSSAACSSASLASGVNGICPATAAVALADAARPPPSRARSSQSGRGTGAVVPSRRTPRSRCSVPIHRCPARAPRSGRARRPALRLVRELGEREAAPLRPAGGGDEQRRPAQSPARARSRAARSRGSACGRRAVERRRVAGPRGADEVFRLLAKLFQIHAISSVEARRPRLRAGRRSRCCGGAGGGHCPARGPDAPCTRPGSLLSGSSA